MEAFRKGVRGPTRALPCRLVVVAFSVITVPHSVTSVAACGYECTMGHMCHNRFADAQDVGLAEANMRGADLTAATLIAADSSGSDLHQANLSQANLTAVTVSDNSSPLGLVTRLTEANLRGADLGYVGGEVTNEGLGLRPESLKGATMPDGQKYEDWIKSKDRRQDGEDSSPSQQI
jgi:hypothetical protein